LIYQINAMTIAVMAALGGIAAYLANRNIAVFSDGVRPVYQSYFNNETDRKTLFASSFALSIGLIFTFGLPISVTGGIIIAHTVFLACDIIGTFFKDDRKGIFLSALTGAVFGVILLVLMQGIFYVFSLMPVQFTGDLSEINNLVVVLFCVFPALAAAYQTNTRNGLLVLALTILVRQLTAVYGKFSIGSADIALDADSTALFFAIIAMVFVALVTSKKSGASAGEAFAVFGKNIDRIKKNILLLALSGGIAALATTLLLVAEGPASMAFTAEGRYSEAALAALARCIGFIPLVMTTAIISGVYSPSGTKALYVPAILFINLGIIGIVGSFLTGALIMVIEVLLLGFIAKGLDRFPGMKELGDNTRTAMGKILDIALLIGGMMAANAIAPTIGYIWVIGLFYLNQNSKKPLPGMAIGPIGAISMGLIVNILHLARLFP